MTGITTILCKVGEDPKVWECDNASVEGLQKIVGGYFERIPLEPQIDAWVNEDGNLWNLPANRFVDRKYDGMAFLILGDFIVMASNGRGGYRSLTQEEIDRWLPKLNARPNS